MEWCKNRIHPSIISMKLTLTSRIEITSGQKDGGVVWQEMPLIRSDIIRSWGFVEVGVNFWRLCVTVGVGIEVSYAQAMHSDTESLCCLWIKM